jgi:hypothetical protein
VNKFMLQPGGRARPRGFAGADLSTLNSGAFGCKISGEMAAIPGGSQLNGVCAQHTAPPPESGSNLKMARAPNEMILEVPADGRTA